MSRPSSRAIACPAAEAAPDAPNVQKRYKADSAGIARPDVIDEMPTPGRTLIKAWVRDWQMLLGFVRYEVNGIRARYMGAAAMTIAPEGLTLRGSSVSLTYLDFYTYTPFSASMRFACLSLSFAMFTNMCSRSSR